MENDFMKRGFLLPDGQKNLADVPKYKPNPAPVRLIIAELAVPDWMTVRELASALKLKPHRIVADFMELGMYATINYKVTFDMIEKVLRKYGYIAKRTV
jgi:hypothetical protein